MTDVCSLVISQWAYKKLQVTTVPFGVYHTQHAPEEAKENLDKRVKGKGYKIVSKLHDVPVTTVAHILQKI